MGPSCGMARYSAWPPWPEKPKTASPAFQRVTPGPVSAMVPAKSVPRMRCLGAKSPVISRPGSQSPPGKAEARMRQSAVETEAAATLTRIAPSPAAGRGASAIATTSGDP